MSILGRLFGRKPSPVLSDPPEEVQSSDGAPPEPITDIEKKDTNGGGAEPGSDSGSGRSYCFIVSGNPSLIGNTVEQISGLGLDVGYFQADQEDLRVASKEAKGQGLQFAGLNYLGKNSSPAEDLGDVMQKMASEGGTGTINIACALATPMDLTFLRIDYNTILSGAVRQGILPFPMFVTENVEAAQFLLDRCTEVRSSFAGKRLEEV